MHLAGVTRGGPLHAMHWTESSSIKGGRGSIPLEVRAQLHTSTSFRGRQLSDVSDAILG
jgi:hypothetical protein